MNCSESETMLPNDRCAKASKVIDRKAGQISGIRIVRKVTFRFGPVKAPAQGVLLLDSQSDKLSADRLAFLTTGQRLHGFSYTCAATAPR